MMTRYLVFTPGKPEPEERHVELEYDPGFDALSDLINPIVGGNLEHVSVLYTDKRRDMFVHDSGLIDGLPRNDAATAIYRANWLKRYPKADPETLHIIAGTAVLFPDRQVWF